MFGNLSSQEQDAIIKLYVAFFARAPEWSGANYWAAEFQKFDSAMSADQKMDNIAERVLSDSYNFSATGFTADMPLEAFVKQMYLNALGRGETAFSALGRKAAPGQEEIDYWVNEISAGRETRAGFGLQIFRDAEAFAEGGTAPTEEIGKYKFQSAFNANRLAIAKEFVKLENSGELHSDQAIIAGREVLKGVPMVRLGEGALSQYITRKLAAPEDPSLYERVPPLSASSLVAEITEAEALAVGGSLPSAGGQLVLSLSGNGVSDGDVSAGGNSGSAGANNGNSGTSNNGGGDVSAGGNSGSAGANSGNSGTSNNGDGDVSAGGNSGSAGANNGNSGTSNNGDGDVSAGGNAGNAGANSGNSGASNNGGGDGKDMLRLIGPLESNAKIDMSQPFDQVIRKTGGDDSDVDGPVQQNFVNVDLSGVTGENGATIIAHTGGSTIIGSKNSDLIIGGTGVDVIDGGGGNDIIQGSLADSIDGGDGKDMLRLTGPLQANAMIDLGQSGDQVGRHNGNGDFEVTGSVQQNFENVDLSLVTGTHGATIIAHSSGGLIFGSKNVDTITGSAGVDVIDGGGGGDIITGSLADSIDGGDGVDMLRLAGPLQANAMIDLGQSGDQIGRHNGNGVFEALGPIQQNFEYFDLSLVTGAHGALIKAHSNGSFLIGSKNSDLIIGGAGIDYLYGKGGNDIIQGSLADSIDGGEGTDMLRLTGPLQANAMIDLGQSGDQAGRNASGDFEATGSIQRNFENVDLSLVTGENGATIIAHTGGSSIIGSKNADTITGGAGIDYLYGGGGNDIIQGSLFDSMNGGEGRDMLRLTGPLQANTMIDLGQSGDQTGRDGIGAFEATDSFQQYFENVDLSGVTGENGAAIIAHTGGSNITGSKNSDLIIDGAGVDAIDGGGGHDIIQGSLADSIDGGDGKDMLFLTGPLQANAMIDLDQSGDQVGGRNASGDFEALGSVQQNFENVDLSIVTGESGTIIKAHSSGSLIFGSRYADTIRGGAGDDTIAGGGGIDTFSGGAGDDIITGNLIDIMDGGNGQDTIRLTGSLGSNAMIDLSRGGDQVGTKNNGNFWVTGAAQQNFEHVDLSAATDGNGATILAWSGGSRIIGSAGADIITGHSGVDTLTGGAGEDQFVFDIGDYRFGATVGGENFDTITDFTTGSDKLRFAAETTLAAAGTSGGLTISFGGKITGFASGANLAAKLAAIASDNRFDGGRKVAFFEDGNHTYIYHSLIYSNPGSSDHHDKMLIKLTDVTGLEALFLNSVSSGRTSYVSVDLYDGILGTEGNDRLRGHIDDNMNGLGGSDTLVLSGPLDTNLMIDLSEDGDQVGIEGSRGNLQPAGAVQQNFEHVDISGVTGGYDVSITAHSGGSRIIGSNGINEITGGDGADTISGGDDYDIIRGGAGDDRLEGGGRYDWISGGAGNDIIDGGEGNSSTLYGGSGNDIITGGSGRDHMMGGLDRDTLNGLGGDDELHGGPGDDIITGGTGRDWLEGGGGIDIFVFRAGDSGINVAAGSEDFDIISDFAIGSDKLRFVAETALAAAGTSDGLAISFGGEITGFASGANLAGKIAAIDSNNRFDIANRVALFEDDGDSYVYHTGDSADNGDDMLIKLFGVVGAGEMSLANVQIDGIHYLDISFA